MADLNVNSIGDASGGNTATINGYAPTLSNMAGRNRIINGDMRIDARNAGSALTINNVGIYSVDRWSCIVRPTGGGVYSAQQVSDAPTGFGNSLKFTVTTADTSLDPNDYYFFWQKIEGYNTADLMFGTANAKPVTLSFWVKSSITGQFSAFLTNSSELYSQPSVYTINAANTWEYKTLTFTGATAGTWIGATNGTGLVVGFGLANGTSLQGTSGSWGATYYYGSTGDVNWMATNGNTFQVTGVQLEAGSVATPFEHRQYGQELALCQRYYEQLTADSTLSLGGYGRFMTATAGGSGVVYGVINFVVTKRASPTLSYSGTYRWQSTAGSDSANTTSLTLVDARPYAASIYMNAGSGGTAGYGGANQFMTSTSYVGFSAEL